MDMLLELRKFIAALIIFEETGRRTSVILVVI
jgi:hypothetical protein